MEPPHSGGPDAFGYTWEDGETAEWIDAYNYGTDTGMSGDSNNQAVPVTLRFLISRSMKDPLIICIFLHPVISH